jgi:hypothetical protein
MFGGKCGQVDNAAPLGLPQQREAVPNAPDSGEDPLIECVVPRFICEIAKSTCTGRSDGIDKSIYASPTVADGCEGAVDRLVVCRVGRDGQNVSRSGGPNVVLGSIEGFLPATEHGDVSAIARKAESDGKAHSRRPATDHTYGFDGHGDSPLEGRIHYIDVKPIPDLERPRWIGIVGQKWWSGSLGSSPMS